MPAQDQEFESTFADLAFSSMRDKAPSLFDYLVGFQVLDQTEDQTHAVGVFGCHVGDEWVYVPVFFHNGELKSGMLYLKNQDMFVPLEENWVTYILNRKPYSLGNASDVTRKQLSQAPPDFTSFSYSPSSWNKAASVRIVGWKAANLQDWAQPFAVAWKNAYGIAEDARYKKAAANLDLGNFIRTCGPTVASIVAGEMVKHASTLGESVLKFYDPFKDVMVQDYDIAALACDTRIRHEKQAKVYSAGERIPGAPIRTQIPGVGMVPGVDGRDAATELMKYDGSLSTKKANDKDKACEHESPKAKDDTTDTYWSKDEKSTIPAVEVIDNADLSGPETSKSDLSAEERERLMKGEIVIRDHRKNTSTVYAAEIGKNIVSPDSTGIYKMLVQGSSDLDDIMMIAAPLTIGAGKATCVTAVLLSKKKAANLPAAALTVINTTVGPNDWMRHFNSLPKVSSMEKGKGYVIVTANGKGTIPFEVVHKKEGLDGQVELWCLVNDHVSGRYENRIARRTSIRADVKHDFGCGYVSKYDIENAKDGEEPWRRGRHIVLIDRAGGLANVGDTLFVPSTARVQPIEFSSYGSDFPSPGTADDAFAFILQSNFVSPVKVSGLGAGEYAITSNEKTSGALSYGQALADLVVTHGLAEAPARDLLKQANINRGVKVLVQYTDECPLGVKMAAEKQADDPSWFNPGPGAPAMPDQLLYSDPTTGRPANEPQTNYRPIPELLTPPGNRKLYNPDPRLDQNPYQLAQQAGQTEQKEVFDPGVVGSLLKVVDSDALVDKYLGDLFLGLDRVGRILFLYYQHNDAFRERYGDEDQPELEDSLKNVFTGLGDLVLFLKQTTVEPSPEANRTQINLGGMADQH